MFLASSRSFFKAHRHLATTRRHATTLIVGGDAAVANAVTAAKTRDPDATLELLLPTKPTTTPIPAGISKVWYISADHEKKCLAETLAAAVVQLQQQQPLGCILGTSTKWGSTVMPRIGALVDASPITDIVAIENATTFVRPLYAGNALVRVRAGEGPQVLSVRPTAFEAAAETTTTEDIPMEQVDGAAAFTKSEWVSADDTGGDTARPDLSQAKIVVSGGRGLNHQFTVIEDLADSLGAAVGASRAAVDAGMAPNNLQVGQTGTVVAPNLYVAVGISGAIQHISGMKDSKTVVAINKDPEAPIFQIADYGLVADLFEAVPEMKEKLQQ